MQKGLDAYSQGLYEQAFSLFQKEAAKGNAEAEYYIGLQYEEGKGVSKDTLKAFENISAAAQQRLVLAQYRLGFFMKTVLAQL